MKRTLPLTVAALALAGALPTLAGCPKDPPPVVFDAAPPPVVSSAPAEVALLEDASVPDEGDADAEAGAKKPGGDLSSARVTQCCNAIAAQAKALGASPEAGLLNGVVSSCRVVASQVKPGSTGAELAGVRAAIKALGKPIPSLCN